MRQENVEAVMKVFFEYPEKKFTVREISKFSGIARASVHKILIKLKKEGLVKKEGIAETNTLFEIKKINYYVEKIVSSGVIDFLEEKFVSSAIVLFGSIRKGESVKTSDVDFYVESQIENSEELAMGIDLKKFEKKIGHKIQLFVYPSLRKVSGNLKENIINGIKLQGYLSL